MELDIQVKLGIYRAFAETGKPPLLGQLAADIQAPLAYVRDAYARLAASRLLVLEPNGYEIRMAPPFSGVPTQHRVRSGGTDYFANCAWDALGIPAALHRPAEVDSRCEQSLEPLHLAVGTAGPEATPWLFHCAVPAAKWWQDIVFT
jgi:hypothetical protein